MPVRDVLDALQLQVRQFLDPFCQRRRALAQGRQQPSPLIGIAHPDVADRGHRPAVQLRRQKRHRTAGAGPGGQGRLPRRLGEQPAPSAQRPRRVLRRVEQIDGQRRGAHLVQVELELGHHAEVPAAAA
jgi:hypothetical protein